MTLPVGWYHPLHIDEADTHNESEQAHVTLAPVRFIFYQGGPFVICMTNLCQTAWLSGWKLKVNTAQLLLISQEALHTLNTTVMHSLKHVKQKHFVKTTHW